MIYKKRFRIYGLLLIGLLLSANGYANDFGGTYTGTKIEGAWGDVTTSLPTVNCVIAPGADVTFVASGTITLRNGFHAQSGSNFNAKKCDSGNTDIDGDSLPDCWELEHIGNMEEDWTYEIHTDEDRMPDGWEFHYLDTIAEGDHDDHDQDGLSNYQEYLQNTDPDDPNDNIGFNIVQFTDNDVDDVGPSSYNSEIAWLRREGSGQHLNNWTVRYYNGSIDIEIANSANANRISLHNGKVAWSKNKPDMKSVIEYWDGNITKELKASSGWYNHLPCVYNAKVVWTSSLNYSGNTTERINYWDGTTIKKITEYGTEIGGGLYSHSYSNPSLHNGIIAMCGYDQAAATGWQIFTTNINSPELVQTSDNENMFNMAPSQYDEKIAWAGMLESGSGYDIYYWNGTNEIKLTDDNSNGHGPSLYDGKIAWYGNDGNDTEIYYWDGTNVYQVTNNTTTDNRPSFHNGRIIWSGFDGEDYEIYYVDINN